MSRQERAARTRRALIRSAAAVFEECGYAQASLALISAGAGVSAGALHFHFESKAAVAAAVEAEALCALRAASRDSRREGGCALQDLVDATHSLASLLCWDTVTRAGFRISCEGARGGEVDLHREWQDRVERLLAAADGEGGLAAEVSRKDTAVAVVAATVGLEVLGRRDREWLSRTSLTGFWRLLLPQIAAPGQYARLEPAGLAVPVRGLPDGLSPVGAADSCMAVARP
ncbi:TetR family transcriptional regulator [Streptomyces sp. MUM 203J]|uniref:ScbR family autoregulator-binding transcription factor n=1 Tax=Streptomyces sp. MUM 203J TaxID=2791990 RepID=UPI001F03F252|nr:ScbR family autoregulator-binding transcription factor [Streptomyces sp. MUM 203J]MCH0540229.1 TetR family transcriptional regulator [Streptomyces sp. MUM 203J]